MRLKLPQGFKYGVPCEDLDSTKYGGHSIQDLQTLCNRGFEYAVKQFTQSQNDVTKIFQDVSDAMLDYYTAKHSVHFSKALKPGMTVVGPLPVKTMIAQDTSLKYEASQMEYFKTSHCQKVQATFLKSYVTMHTGDVVAYAVLEYLHPTNVGDKVFEILVEFKILDELFSA